MKKFLYSVLLAVLAVTIALFAVGCAETDDNGSQPEPPAKYALSYAGGEGATGTAPETKEYEANVKVKLADNPFTLADHTFAGWSDGTTVYDEGADFTMPAHAVTLTAKWTKNEPEPPAKYALSYAGGEGATGTAPETKEYEANVKVKLADNPFTRTDHVFAGWSDGTTVYDEGADFTMPAHAVTLTAQWDELFTLTYQGGEGATGAAPASSDHVEGDVFELPACPSDLTNGDKTFMGWSDGEETYQAGDDFTMPAEDVTLTAQWKGPSELAGKSFYSLTDKTLYQFGSEEQDGFYSVTKIHLEGYSYQTSTDTVRYSYDGKEYKVQVKGDTWTDALTLTEVGKEITLEGKVCYLCGVAQTVKTADEALTLGFTLDANYDANYGLQLTFTALTVDGQTAEQTEFSLSNYTLSVAYDKEGTTYRVTVSLADLSYTSEVYRITLTAKVDGVTYRATFSDPYSDYFRTLEKFAVQKGSEWQELVTENKSGASESSPDGKNHYAFTVSVTEDSTKTTYKIFAYTAAAEKEAYFTVTKSEEHVKVTKTLTTTVGDIVYETTWEYDDPNDAELTKFIVDGDQKWASKFYYGKNTAEKTGNNVYVVTYTYDELIIDDEATDQYHTETHTVVLRVTFVPAQDVGEHSVKIAEIAYHDVTFGDDVATAPGKQDGLTWENGDGLLHYQITVTVDQDGQIASLKELVLYRSYWSVNKWHRVAAFTPEEGLEPDENGFYVFTQKVTASRTNGQTQEVTWHIRLKITAKEGEDQFEYELHLQNEATFEIDGKVIPELTVLVDEKGEVTLPTAEEVAPYLPEGKTFEGWKLGEDAQEGPYTTGGYGNSYFPTAADVKFVASLKAVNVLAGKTYVDFKNSMIYVFTEEQTEGYYTVLFYSKPSYSFTEDKTSMRYSFSEEDGYTVYKKNGELWDEFAKFASVEGSLTFGESTVYLSGSRASFEVTEGEQKIPFSFDFTASASFNPTYQYVSVSITTTNHSYHGYETTLSSDYNTSAGTIKVKYQIENTVYEATVTMGTLTSSVSVFAVIMFSADEQYRAEFSGKVSDGYNYITFSVKDEKGTYNRVGTAQAYRTSTNHWEIQISKNEDVTEFYSVDYIPEKDGASATMTVQILKSKAFETTDYRVTVVWDTEGDLSLKLLQYRDTYWVSVYDPSSYSPPASTVEKLSDNIIKVELNGITYTITLTIGEDGTPESFTVVKS